MITPIITISDEIKDEVLDRTGNGINAYLLANYARGFLQKKDVRDAATKIFNLSSLNGWAISVELQGRILIGHNRNVVKTAITIRRAEETRQKNFALKLTSPFAFYRMKPADIAKELEISRKFDQELFFNEHYSKTYAVATYVIDPDLRRKIRETYGRWMSTVNDDPDPHFSFQLDTWVDGIKGLELIRRVSKSPIPANRKRSLIKNVIKRISLTAFKGWRSLKMEGIGLIFDINPDDVIFLTQPGEDIFQMVEKGTVVFIDADGGRSMGEFSKLAEALNKSQCFVERLG